MANAKKPRRGASRGPTRNGTRRQVPGWVWLFTGVAVGLFVAFLVHLGHVQMSQGSAGLRAVTAPQSGGKSPNQEADKTKKKGEQPKFDFYAVLPKMEVIAPKDNSQAPGKQGAGANTDNDNPPTAIGHGAQASPSHPHNADNTGNPDNGDQGRYMLQAGSFHHQTDADQRRAKLILKGFQVSVQPVQLDNGETWHRVMIGPYKDLTDLHAAQDKLIALGIETLPIQVKNQ